MKAVISTQAGVQVVERPQPKAAAHEIVVRVKAIGMNRADLAALKDPRDQVMGMEWAGEVVETGADVTGMKPGDRVMCTGTGAYAEFAVADAQRCAVIPDAVPWEHAASLMLGLQTMHDALVTHGRLDATRTVLMQGGASCMGLIGMQLARQLGAGKILGTSRNPEHRQRLIDYGCDVAIDSSVPNWEAAVLEATGGQGANITVDQIAGEAINNCMAATAINGHIINVGRLGGATAKFDLNLHALRRINFVGVTFRTRSREEIRTLNEKMLRDAMPHLAAIKVPVAAQFEFARINDALACQADAQHFGKVLLRV
ncbi:MAG: zinc-binding dehydrogenase [Bdellovibrionales bacterium]|nr:zinc-binding dehydrogenase [Ramlibacter sp.]